MSFDSAVWFNPRTRIMDKFAKDWKFLAQLALLLVSFGGMLNVIANLSKEVEELKHNDHVREGVLIRMEGKFDLQRQQNEQLLEMIKELKAKLEAKKIVNAIGFEASNIVGARVVQK